MSGFDLVSVDGGAPVHLPPGETVLGRGPLLGVSDKRVSRHHGLLENLNGQLRLKPTHVNPCFVQSSPDDEDPRSLKKDSWYTLHHGDFISLLPGQFVYEVVAVGGDERTLRNSQALEEEERELPGSPESHVEPANPVRADPGQTVTSSAPSNKEEDDVKTRVNQGNVAPSVTRKRVLPAWMMTTAAASSPTALKKIKAPAAAGEATPTTVSSPERAGLSQEKRLRKRRRRRSDEEEDTGTKTAPSGRLQPAPVRSEVNRSEVSDESDNVTMEEEGVGVRGQSSSDTNIRMETSEDEMSERQQTTGRTETAGSDAGAVSKPRVRTPCPYGKDCYRKNPLHFQECSHPGDSDYQEEEEEAEAEGEERPECPYGTDCYRKNPLHRKEFKHTRRPARSTRAVPQRSPADDEDVEDDDSFINDDSEDGDNDEDKDYVPLDSDDSGTEDVRRLQREAQEFLRRRK